MFLDQISVFFMNLDQLFDPLQKTYQTGFLEYVTIIIIFTWRFFELSSSYYVGVDIREALFTAGHIWKSYDGVLGKESGVDGRQAKRQSELFGTPWLLRINRRPMGRYALANEKG